MNSPFTGFFLYEFKIFMYIFEMIFIQVPEDKICFFYFENNVITREKFIRKIEEKIQDELVICLGKIQNQDRELINFYKNIYIESLNNILKIKNKFIQTGFANLESECILKVECKYIEK